MPFDGNGNYSLPTPSYPAVPGAVITAAYRNTIDEDLANALSNVLCRDGQSAATGNLPMGGFKLTGLATGASAGDSLRFEQLYGAVGPATAAAARANLEAFGTAGGAVTGRAYTPPVAVAHATNPIVDASLSNVFHMGLLTSPISSMTINNSVDGQTIMCRFKQDGTGGRTVVFVGGTTIKVAGAVETGAGRVSWLNLTYVASETRWEGSWSVIPA